VDVALGTGAEQTRPNARWPPNIGGYPVFPLMRVAMSEMLMALPTADPGARSHRGWKARSPGLLLRRRTGAMKLAMS
jgi:hypothetical protein